MPGLAARRNGEKDAVQAHYGVLWCGALITGAAGYSWWPAGQGGNDLACVASVVAWMLCIQMTIQGWQAYDTAAVFRRVRRRATRRQDLHGQASWATWKDCRRAGLHKRRGFFLGTLNGRELFYGGEGSMVVFGGPGQHKTTASVLQQLLRLDRRSSAVVMDLKLECWAVTAKDLKRRGFDVKLVCPWFASFNRDFQDHLIAQDDGLDPCLLLVDSPSITDDCRVIGSLLSGESLRKGTSTEEHFKALEIDILVAFLLLLIHRHGSVTLPDLRRALMSPETELEAAIEEMEESDAFSGVLREYGARLAAPYVNSRKEWSGGLSGAMRCLNFLDAHSPVSRSMGREAKTDPRTIKDRPTVIFLGIPSEKLRSHEAWLGICVTSILELIARDRRKKRVLAIIDEAQNLPPSVGSILLRAVALYRGVGIQCLLYYQFLAGAQRQLDQSYRELLGADVVGLFGHTNDLETLKLFSALLGDETVRSLGVTAQPGGRGGGEAGSVLGDERARASDAACLGASAARDRQGDLPSEEHEAASCGQAELPRQPEAPPASFQESLLPVTGHERTPCGCRPGSSAGPALACSPETRRGLRAGRRLRRDMGPSGRAPARRAKPLRGPLPLGRGVVPGRGGRSTTLGDVATSQEVALRVRAWCLGYSAVLEDRCLTILCIRS
jgi:type IV secretion system protein VirD4